MSLFKVVVLAVVLVGGTSSTFVVKEETPTSVPAGTWVEGAAFGWRPLHPKETDVGGEKAVADCAIIMVSYLFVCLVGWVWLLVGVYGRNGLVVGY